MTKRLSDLLAALPQPYQLSGSADPVISAPVVETDAEVEPGGVFVARTGLTVDGHDFIPHAIERGAAAVIGEKAVGGLSVPYVQVENSMEAVGYLAAAYYDFPTHDLVVIGVTGTDGKTTTCTLIHSILQAATGGKAGLISTINADIGGKTLDTGFHVTTPSAPMIQRLLAQMVANGLTHVVLEMTSHGLVQGRLNGIDIDCAVLTNITHEHLDYHKTFEHYRLAKGRLFEMLKSNHVDKRHLNGGHALYRYAIVNQDDPNADYFYQIVSHEPGLFAEGFSRDVQKHPPGRLAHPYYHAREVIHAPGETIFQIWRDRGDEWFDCGAITTPLVGEFNIMNILTAFAAVFSMRLSLPREGKTYKRGDPALVEVKIIPYREAIAAVTAIPGRLERIDEGQDFTALVDFAHTPNALKNALQAARTLIGQGGRVICVFGCAGLRDREKRRMMPEVAAQLADFSVFTAEDPRTESLDDILQTMADAAIQAGGEEWHTFMRVPDRGEALFRACQMALPRDVVIACGKGHEQSMAFGAVEYAWDDRVALRAALHHTPLRTLPTAAP